MRWINAELFQALRRRVRRALPLTRWIGDAIAPRTTARAATGRFRRRPDIAARAAATDLYTCNPDDFSGIEGLDVVVVAHPDEQQSTG